MVFLSISSLLISNAVSSRRDKSIMYSRVASLILASCVLICINCLYINFQDKGLGLFGGLYNITAISLVFQTFILIITLLIIQLNSFYPRNSIESRSVFSLIFAKLEYFNSFILNKMSQQYRIIEYPLIILFAVIGGIFLMSSSDIISIFISLELQSYALYILCVIYRDSEKATSGGLTYFLLGGLSSCFILLAFGLLYSNSGNTGLDGLYVISNISSFYLGDKFFMETVSSYIYLSHYINFSLVIMSVGFLFKISAAPFHFWSPDVYDAIPTLVTTFVAIFAKISILILLLELVHYTCNIYASYIEQAKTISLINQNSSVNVSWTFTLIISSFLSLVIGSVLGLTQSRIKRLYAYSTISHIGFILLALSINSIESVQSFIFYLMQYSLSNLNAFILLIAIGYSLYLYVEKNDNEEKKSSDKNNLDDYSDRNNSPIQLITDIKGFFFINPMISVSLGITLFSFVGIPPLIGFFAKQMVLTSALESGYLFMTLVAILTSVISAYYYLVLVKEIFFNPSFKEKWINDFNFNQKLISLSSFNKEPLSEINDYSKLNKRYNIYLGGSLTSIISILTLIIFLFMFTPQEWLNITTILSLILFNC